jgi:signal transduction histidine kinase
MRLWPRTLGIQLIAVTVGAVFLSNVAVAVWFQLTSERLTESAVTERVLDRTASTATLLSAIPAKARAEAAHAMSSAVWQFELHYGKDMGEPMDAAESRLAQRLRAMIQPERAKYPVTVKYERVPIPPQDPSAHGPRQEGDAIRLVVPVVRNAQLVATFVRPRTPTWPLEMVIAAVTAIVVASSGAAYLARRMTRPLSELADAATVVAGGGAAPRVPEEGPEDVRNAAAAFNTMVNKVTRTLESQRHLLSAVGHDLRTPLTAMRINLEFIEDAELRDRLVKNLDELQELTEAVLSAARGAGGEAGRNVDLAALIDSVCADLDELGEPVVWSHTGPAPLCCRPNEIRRAVRNLVENAIAYGRKADVRLERTPAHYEIVVEDEGPGIRAEDRVRVFEPFVRLESSRNAETGGTGLGLTLVKSIAEGHGGHVFLEDRDKAPGLRVRLRLPREPVAA